MKRPSRSMVKLRTVAEFWRDRPDAETWPIGFAEPACMRCGWLPPAPPEPAKPWTRAIGLERAHVIDRCSDGLDGVQNLVMLCEVCHDEQPWFRNGDEDAALDWMKSGTPCPVQWQTFTDEAGHLGWLDGPKDLRRLRQSFDRALANMALKRWSELFPDEDWSR